jgi:glutamate/tyrosine decarboxylase-like PLP-dependent enzyme
MTPFQEKLLKELSSPALFEEALESGLEYIKNAQTRNVYPTEDALADLSVFSETLPSHTTEGLNVIRQLHEYGGPATVAQTGGRYFGFVNGGVIPTGLAAKLLGTFWDQNTAMHVISPLASTLESVVESWLRDLFKLPSETVAGFTSGTSMANLCGLAAGRYRLLKDQGWDVNIRGLQGSPPIRIIAGREAHSTILKTISILGFGYDSITFVDCDDQGRINLERIPEITSNTLLILQAGNVNSGSFDNFSAVTSEAKEKGAWIHIDGAFGLWAAASSSLSYLTNGIEHASSWAVDGHKTLNTPYDCGIALCKDKEALTNALHMSAGYLVLGEGRDGMFYTPEMSRRARIIELWATMKCLGRAGIDELVSGLHERARQFASELSQVEGFNILNDVVFNQVVACCENDELTAGVIEAIQKDRVCWVGGSTWKGRKVIRISVCSWMTTEEDVRMSVDSFRKSFTIAKAQTKN